MSASGLETFDRSIHATNAWLKGISREIGAAEEIGAADRKLAWRVLGVVLRALRDRLPVDDAAHLAAQLPLLIRGAFCEQYRPAVQPTSMRSRAEFIARVADGLEGGGRPINPERAIKAVFSTVQRHVAEAETAKVRHALPEDIRMLWPAGVTKVTLQRLFEEIGEAGLHELMADPNFTVESIDERVTLPEIKD